jgi:hypothetical protein
MATVRFRLIHPSKNGELKTTPVPIAAVYYSKETGGVEISTGERVEPKNWKGTRVTSKAKDHDRINKHLSKIEGDLLEIWRNNKALPAHEIKELVRASVKGGSPEAAPQKKTVIEAVQRFIAQYEREKEAGTVKRYRVLLNKLTAFNPDLTFDKLDFEFYTAFKNFLYDTPNPVYSKYSLVPDIQNPGAYLMVEGNKGMTVGLMDDVVFKYFVNIKTVCAWAEKRGYEVNPAYKNWEIIKREYEPISLTFEELQSLEGALLPNHLDIARDYLSLECRTGQRISDLRRFNKDDIEGDVWSFYQVKGNRIKSKLIELPLDGFAARARVILQKYDYVLPKLSEQKINKSIKEACKIAGIDSHIYIERWAGNMKIRIPGKKYEFVSTHTGKKSFITILASEGVPVSVLSLLTGTSQKTIERHYLSRIPTNKVRDYLTKAGNAQDLMKKAQ